MHRKQLSKKVCAAVRARRHASAADKLQSCPLNPLCEQADVGASITIALHKFVGWREDLRQGALSQLGGSALLDHIGSDSLEEILAGHRADHKTWR